MPSKCMVSCFTYVWVPVRVLQLDPSGKIGFKQKSASASTVGLWALDQLATLGSAEQSIGYFAC